ncbi:MAG: ribosome silencing factor [Candidatus Omnitrophica bacterium]|nr:ribosome silencing factor [Candidatus Omnitrophota bacterium]MBD3269013.1 ribosome silencing factor [Candidatus Omnitrophota bacterium]
MKKGVTITRKTSEKKNKVLQIVDLLRDKKAVDIVAFDTSKVSTIWDYFIICSGESDIQVRAIYEAVLRQSKKKNIEVKHHQTDNVFRWLLIDFHDTVLHIFSEDARRFYNFERLLNSAREIKLKK